MAKHTDNYEELAKFEIKAQEFISLTFDLCEEELNEHRLHHTERFAQRRKALQFSALSIRDSIKSFLANVQIEAE